jgi:RNA polymerase sigma-70 factor (ECF subfamily)
MIVPVFFPETFWTLIQKAKQKDPQAMNEIVRIYRPPIVNFLRYKGVSEHDADDLAQEVFLAICQDKFLSKLDKCKGKFRSVLCAVTVNILKMRQRDQGRIKRGGGGKKVAIGSDEQDGMIDDVIARTPSPEQQFTAEWIQTLVNRAVDKLRNQGGKLGPVYHKVFLMHKMDGASHVEIAKALKMKESDVNNYVHAAKKKLREFIEEEIRTYCSSQEEYELEVGELLALTGT